MEAALKKKKPSFLYIGKDYTEKKNKKKQYLICMDWTLRPL